MTTGLDALRQRIEDAERTRKQFLDGLELKIKSNELAKIRILTEGPNILTLMFHSVSRVSRNGKSFNEEVYCEGNPGGEGDCQYCNSENLVLAKTRDKIFMWVWVYHVLHPTKDTENKWVLEKRGGLSYYREEVNKLKLLNTSEGFGGYIAQTFIGMYSKYGTLCDRDYDWVRQGASLDTTYSLLPDDLSSASSVIVKVMDNLPDLLEAAKTRIMPDSGVIVGQTEVEIPLLERLRSKK